MSAARKTAFGAALLLVIGMVAFEADEVEVVCGPDPNRPAAFAVGEGFGRAGKIGHKLTQGEAPSVMDTYRVVMGGIGTISGWIENFESNLDDGVDSTWQTGWRFENEKRRAAAIASCCPTQTPPPKDNPPPEAPKPPQDWDPKWASLQDPPKDSQAAIVRTIVAVGKAKQVPYKGWLEATATGLVESELRNLNYGDRDSLGVFQQRPSQGWGSAAQVRDVRYAAAKFYDHLVRIDGWESMKPGRASQMVQRSAYPDKYGKRMAEAKRFVAAAAGERGERVEPAPPDTPNISCESQSNTVGDEVPIDTKGGGPSPKVFDRQGNPRTADEAVRWIEKMIANKTPITPDMCARYMAIAYGHPNSGCYGDHGCTAIGLWHAIPAELKHPGKSDPPRGALVWWNTKNSARHIAMSLGNGKIASTDVPEGRIGVIDLEEIDKWGPRIGWAAPHWPIHQGSRA